MSLQKIQLSSFPLVQNFFTDILSSVDLGTEEGFFEEQKNLKSKTDYLKLSSELQKLLAQLQGEISPESMSSLLEEMGMQCNRWFGDFSELKAWLGLVSDQVKNLVKHQDGASSGEETLVKDSNGAVLLEGDSVTVIKDLKVKGGSSDLKRGTLIKKIHLIGDSENVECRVDGSTLVLKTCFLKKAGSGE